MVFKWGHLGKKIETHMGGQSLRGPVLDSIVEDWEIHLWRIDAKVALGGTQRANTQSRVSEKVHLSIVFSDTIFLSKRYRSHLFDEAGWGPLQLMHLGESAVHSLSSRVR